MGSDFDVSYRPDPDGRRRAAGVAVVAVAVALLVLALVRLNVGGTTLVDAEHLDIDPPSVEQRDVACTPVLAGPRGAPPETGDLESDDDAPATVPEDHERLLDWGNAELASSECDRLRAQQTGQAGILAVAGILLLGGGRALRRRSD